MLSPERVIAALRERGELWDSVPGLTGLRGDTLALYRALERALAALAREETEEEWLTPPGLSFESLARAQYFASFPQWLTAASHMSDERRTLERVALAAEPEAEARAALAPADAALPPAVCYHVYARLAGTVVPAATVISVQATCWRHEGDRVAPLERGWAFTMREIVCIGLADEVERFRQRAMRRAGALAASLDLDVAFEKASDPFFAPTARGKAMLQLVKGLKHELLLSIAPDRAIAAASFNHHERFFGTTFDIRLPDGEVASSGCVAFGIERWLLAYLVRHGIDRNAWPLPETLTTTEEYAR